MHRALVTAIGAVILACVLAIGAAFILADPGASRQLASVLDSPHGLAGLFVLSALSSAALVFPVPGTLLTVVAAAVAPPLAVGIAAGAGQTLGELTGYVAGRGGDTLSRERLSSSRVAVWMTRYGALSLFVLALIPNPVFDIGGILAGALRMPVARFLVAAGAGKVLRNIIIALLVSHGVDALGSSD